MGPRNGFCLVMDPFSGTPKTEEYIITISNAQDDNLLYDYENTLAVPFECPAGQRWFIGLHSITLSNHVDVEEDGDTNLNALKVHIRRLNQQQRPIPEDNYEEFLKDALELADQIDYAATGKNHLTYLLKVMQTGQTELKKWEKKLFTIQMRKTYTAGDLEYIKRSTRNIEQISLWYSQIRKLSSKLNGVYKKQWHKKNSHLNSPIFIELDQILATNACAEKRIGSFFLTHQFGSTHYQPLHHNFFPLQNNYLDKLNIRVKNHKNQILEGLPSNPTVIELILKPENMDDKFDYRTCYVDNGKDQNPFNFTIPLPDEFTDFSNSNKWEMAMIRCCLPNNIFTLPEGMYIEVLERYRGNVPGLPDTLNERSIERVQDVLRDSRADFATYSKKHDLEVDYNPTSTELAKMVVNAVKTMNGFQGLEEGQEDRYSYNNYLDLVQNYHVKADFKDGKFSFKSNRRLVFVMPYFLSVVLGFEQNVRMLDQETCYIEFLDTEPPNTPQIRETVFDDQLDEKKVHAENKRYYLNSNEMADIDIYKPQNLLIECDCLAPAIVGNAYGQYLSYLPLNESTNAFTEFSPLHPEYHEINTNVLNRVNFRCSQIDGQIPRLIFPEAYYKSYFTLSFRRRKDKDNYQTY